jgi:hypothetical protein
LRRNLTSLAALALLVGAGALVAWWMRPAPPRIALPAKPPDDDLEMLAALIDAGEPHEPAHDLLVAGATDLYLARASDNTIVGVPKGGGRPRTIARLEGPVWGMALADGALWVSTTRAGASQPSPDGGRAPAADAHAHGAVEKIPLAGGAPTVVADGLARPRAVASDGRWLFVVDVDASEPGLLHRSTIVRLPAAGGPRAIVARCEGEVGGVVLDDANAYWADRFDGTIVAAPKAGGDPRSLATERGLPEQLVALGGDLYWVEKRSETLWSMPKAGGAPRSIAQDFAGFTNVVVDARGVWWSSEAAVAGRFRVLMAPLIGGDPSPASEAVDAIDALASDGIHLYWARGGEASRVEASAAQRGKEHAREDE